LGDRLQNGSPYAIGLLFVCLSVLSVCDVHVLWPNSWIKMKLGLEVGLGLGHIVLDRNPASLPDGAQPPIFGPCLLWLNGRPSQLLRKSLYDIFMYVKVKNCKNHKKAILTTITLTSDYAMLIWLIFPFYDFFFRFLTCRR